MLSPLFVLQEEVRVLKQSLFWGSADTISESLRLHPGRYALLCRSQVGKQLENRSGSVCRKLVGKVRAQPNIVPDELESPDGFCMRVPVERTRVSEVVAAKMRRCVDCWGYGFWRRSSEERSSLTRSSDRTARTGPLPVALASPAQAGPNS